MATLPRAIRILLLCAYLALLAALTMQWLGDGLTGNWIYVLAAISLLTVAFSWESLARQFRSPH
jgi:hypothetical protein